VTSRGPGPVFVVGSMRSGSTMLRLILDSHPCIAVPPETGFMGAVAATKRIPEWKLGDGWYERLGWTEAEVDERLREFYDGMFRRYAAEQGKPRWGEKTPFHTLHMAQMARLFPDATFVGIVRHPGAVSSSLHRRFHYGFAEAVAYWSETNQEMLRAGMALGDRFGLCRYEDLVQGDEAVLRQLLDLLGEPWAPEVTEHHRVQREKGAPRVAEGSTITSHPVDASRATAWAQSIAPEDLRELAGAAELAGFLGYDVTTPGPPADWSVPGRPQARVVTGTELAERRRSHPVPLSSPATRRPGLEELGVEELAARLARAEAALSRVRSRRAVRLVDAARKVQHGRSRDDLRAAWQVLREATRGPGR
jgi:hypothetical protein